MILPEAFVKKTRDLLGNEFDEFEKALGEKAPTSVRVNNKIDYQPSDEKVAWCDNGFYLPERPLFTADPLFHAGVYYVQEASSMFLAQAVKQFFSNARTVLDLCAAPGGKSTLLSQALPSKSLLVSNEIIRSRAYILAENIVKWGNPNCVVTNNEPKDFEKLPGFFDALVIDAPCSGEGMFRKDPGAIQEWSEYNVKLCTERQRDILSTVWDALKTDGVLVYSTCTYNREENEENVQWICNELGAELLKINISDFPQITESDFGYRFYPHKTKGEGFFMSVLKKTSLVSRSIRNRKDDKKGIKFVINENIKSVSLLEPEKWGVIQNGNLFNAFDKELVSDFVLLNKTLKCMYSGILMGELKGKDFIPAAEIAFSKVLDKSKIESVEVNYQTAIQYLRKDAIYLGDYNRGYLLITYKGLALGWVKNMGNRCNNLYPQEWRIRMNI